VRLYTETLCRVHLELGLDAESCTVRLYTKTLYDTETLTSCAVRLYTETLCRVHLELGLDAESCTVRLYTKTLCCAHLELGLDAVTVLGKQVLVHKGVAPCG